MEDIYKIYYIGLVVVLVLGLAFYTIPRGQTYAHPLGVNLTKDNGTCKVLWLGGIDYDSFYTNVTVNDVNVGHPFPVSEIYNGPCGNITVKAYDKAVRSYIQIYHYNGSGGI